MPPLLLLLLLSLHLREGLICHSFEMHLVDIVLALGAFHGDLSILVNVKPETLARRNIVEFAHAVYEVDFLGILLGEALFAAPNLSDLLKALPQLSVHDQWLG